MLRQWRYDQPADDVVALRSQQTGAVNCEIASQRDFDGPGAHQNRRVSCGFADSV
jgi:hypothetical protein